MGLFDLFSDKNEKKAANAQKAGLRAGRDVAYGELDKGMGEYNRYADQAYGEYAPYADAGRKGTNAYADALGLNGADAAAAARDNFTKSAGYDFARDEAMQAVERSASAAGYLGSGNLATALQDRAAGLASTESGAWLDRLGGLMEQGATVADRQAGVRTGQGANAYANAAARGQIGWNTETGQGAAEAEYQKSKDQSGMNIFNAVTGLIKLGTGA
jgi:hypothetical protein